jgi:hypothetical protein
VESAFPPSGEAVLLRVESDEPVGVFVDGDWPYSG